MNKLLHKYIYLITWPSSINYDIYEILHIIYTTNADSWVWAPNLSTSSTANTSATSAADWLICVRSWYGTAKTSGTATMPLETKVSIECPQEEVIYNGSLLLPTVTIKTQDEKRLSLEVLGKNSLTNGPPGRTRVETMSPIACHWHCPTKTCGIVLKEASLMVTKSTTSRKDLVNVEILVQVPPCAISQEQLIITSPFPAVSQQFANETQLGRKVAFSPLY